MDLDIHWSLDAAWTRDVQVANAANATFLKAIRPDSEKERKEAADGVRQSR